LFSAGDCVTVADGPFAGLPITMAGMSYFIYLLTSGKNGTLYVGVTNNLVRRVFEHRTQVPQRPRTHL